MICDENNALTYDVCISLRIVASFADYYFFCLTPICLKQHLRVLNWNKLIVYCLNK